jgi:hypothetical protein
MKMSKSPTHKSSKDANAGLQWALRDRSGGEGGPTASQPGADKAVPTDPQGMIDAFTESLRGSDLDAEQQRLLGDHFGEVMREAAANPGSAAPLERSDWLDAVEVLRGMGAIDESQGADLIRKLDHAMRPLQKRNVQLAMEFSRRVQEDGEEEALSWFRAQSAAEASDDAGAASPPSGNERVLPAGNVVTQSRSRRLRGPPGR